jgi:putative transposase
MKLIAQV